MTIPKNWTPGDRITAERLNVLQAESLRPRRDINLGQGSSAVNEALGNQSANMRVPLTKLMIAIEDFTIPAGRTDLSVGPDDVPSGLSKQVRLSRNDSTHREETTAFPERVWDALGGLNGTALRQCGEVFYAIFNQDSKRWEVLQSANIRLIPAIVVSCLGGGWHEVNISDWATTPNDFPAAASSSASASASGSDVALDDCSVCTAVFQDGACESAAEIDVERDPGLGIGEIVYAHTTSLLPMMTGGMIKMVKRTTTISGCADSASASGSTSTSVSDDIITDRLYDVVDGVWPLISLPFPTFECCEDPVTGEQTVQMVSCMRAVVEGYLCEGELNPCDTASGSASVSG